MASDSTPRPDQPGREPATPLPDATVKPQPKRVSVGSDPTTPIRLTGAGRQLPPPIKVNQATIKTPTPGPVAKSAPSTADGDDGQWIGAEQTMVGTPVATQPTSDPTPGGVAGGRDYRPVE